MGPPSGTVCTRTVTKTGSNNHMNNDYVVVSKVDFLVYTSGKS